MILPPVWKESMCSITSFEDIRGEETLSARRRRCIYLHRSDPAHLNVIRFDAVYGSEIRTSRNNLGLRKHSAFRDGEL